MSYNIWPQLAGKGWQIKCRPIMQTLLDEAVSGAQYATQMRQYPIYEFDVEIPYLAQADRDTLESFYNQQGGAFLPFMFTYDSNNSETAQSFGTGNGSTVAFNLTRSQNGLWAEPIGGVNGTATILAAGVQIVAAGTGTPASPTLAQTAGGAKAGRTYYARITYVDAAGNESNSSVEASFAVSLNNLLTVTHPTPVTGAVSWNLYLNTATNTEKFQVTTAIGVSYTEPTSALSFAGAAYPVADNTPYSVSQTGVVTFTHAPAAAVALTWTGNFYFLVRFKDDNQVETNQIMYQIYKAKTITLRTAR